MYNMNVNCTYNKEALSLSFNDDGYLEHFICVLLKP